MSVWYRYSAYKKKFPLAVPFEEFINEWNCLIKNPNHDLSILVKALQPYLVKIRDQLENRIEKDIYTIPLLFRLETKYAWEALDLLDSWIQEIDVLNELNYVLIYMLRRPLKYFCTLNPCNLGKQIGFMFHLYLARHIKTYHYTTQVTFPETLIVEDLCKDVILLKHLNTWEHYQLLLLKQGYQGKSLERLVHCPRNSMLIEEKKIWRKVETLLMQQNL